MGALIQSLRQQDKEPDSDSFGRGWAQWGWKRTK
jgi:hypothetical protein